MPFDPLEYEEYKRKRLLGQEKTPIKQQEVVPKFDPAEYEEYKKKRISEAVKFATQFKEQYTLHPWRLLRRLDEYLQPRIKYAVTRDIEKTTKPWENILRDALKQLRETSPGEIPEPSLGTIRKYLPRTTLQNVTPKIKEAVSELETPQILRIAREFLPEFGGELLEHGTRLSTYLTWYGLQKLASPLFKTVFKILPPSVKEIFFKERYFINRELQNAYKTLGVKSTTPLKEIEAIYRKKILPLHPDKPTGDIIKFKNVQNAYDLIKQSRLTPIQKFIERFRRPTPAKPPSPPPVSPKEALVPVKKPPIIKKPTIPPSITPPITPTPPEVVAKPYIGVKPGTEKWIQVWRAHPELQKEMVEYAKKLKEAGKIPKPVVPKPEPEPMPEPLTPKSEIKRSKTTDLIPNKTELIKQIEKAIKNAPEELVPEKSKVKFKINGGVEIVNTKAALSEFLKRVKRGPREISHLPKIPTITPLKPIAAKQELIGPLIPLETKEYFSDGKLLIKGTPPKGAKFKERVEEIPTAQIESLFKKPNSPAKLCYYAIEADEIQGISPSPIPGTKKDIPLVVFESEGKYYLYQQFRFNAIRRRFPQATYRISKDGTLVAYAGKEPVATLMAEKDGVALKDPPFKKEAEEKGFITKRIPSVESKETKPTETPEAKPLPKEHQSLAEEAKKYKSMEEFIKSQGILLPKKSAYGLKPIDEQVRYLRLGIKETTDTISRLEKQLSKMLKGERGKRYLKDRIATEKAILKKTQEELNKIQYLIKLYNQAIKETKPEIKPAELLKKAIEKTPKVKPTTSKPEKTEPLDYMYAGMPIVKPELIKKIKDELIKKFDIEYPLKEIGAPKTGRALKTYLSKRSAGEEKTLKAIEELGKFKLSPADYNKLAFIVEKPTLFLTLSKEQRKAYSPAYHYIRNYFDNYFKILKERIPEKFELPWPQSHIRRLQNENLHLRTAIMRTKNLAKVEKLKKRYDENNALIDFYKTSKIQYVHLPIRLWLGEKFTKNPQLAKQLISATFKSIIGRETPTLEHFVQAGFIKRGEIDIRDIMASYGRYVENQLAQKDILDMAIQEGLAKLQGEAPEDWVSLPTRIAPVLKGYKLHPAFVEILEQYFNSVNASKGNIGRFMASIKMMQFYNPFFLPMYDIVQAGMLGSITFKYPKYLQKAIKDTANKTFEYFKAYEEGLFSVPFANPFNNFMKQVEFVKKHQNNNGNYILDAIDKIKEYLPAPYKIIRDIYNISWNVAWHLDKVLRMASRNYLIDNLKLSSEEASQLAAKFHSDYASIPPQTRKILNKIFFTPIFEIAMDKVYIEMVKNVFNPKVLLSFKKGMSGTNAEKIKKVFARTLVLSAGILFGKDAVVTYGLGFEREQFSRRYYKTVDTEDGEKEVVIVFANPANIPLRYYWKFKTDEAETNYFLRIAKTLFSRVHPVYRIAVEVIRNERDDFKPVYNPFDDPQYQIIDILKYVTAKSIRVSEGFIRGEEVYTKQTQQALINATNKLWANILRPITFRYLRNIKDRREIYQIRNLINEFQRVLIREPDMDDIKYQRRLENFLKKLEAISER